MEREEWATWSDGAGGTFRAGRLVPAAQENKEMSYTPEQLAIVCPKCQAAVGGKCLEKTNWGQKYAAEPHPERVEAAEKENAWASRP